MNVTDEKAKLQSNHAADVLRRLDAIGAINIGVLVSKASEVLNITGASLDDDGDHGICYPFYIRIGPRQDIDIVSVVSQLQSLGFEVRSTGAKAAGAQAKV
jgi:hypothetical protein